MGKDGNKGPFSEALRKMQSEQQAKEALARQAGQPVQTIMDERLTGGPSRPQSFTKPSGTPGEVLIEAHMGLTIMDTFALEAMKVFLANGMTRKDDDIKLPPIQKVIDFCYALGLSAAAKRQGIMAALNQADAAAHQKAPEEDPEQPDAKEQPPTDGAQPEKTG